MTIGEYRDTFKYDLIFSFFREKPNKRVVSKEKIKIKLKKISSSNTLINIIKIKLFIISLRKLDITEILIFLSKKMFCEDKELIDSIKINRANCEILSVKPSQFPSKNLIRRLENSFKKFAVILTENTTIIVKAIKIFPLSLEFKANEMTGTNTWLKTVTIDL